jgi:hypothetical protein
MLHPKQSMSLLAVDMLSRDGFKGALDSYYGVCTIALYFLYLNVVKGALSVFDCSLNKDGVRILDADPSIACDEVRGSLLCSTRALSFTRCDVYFMSCIDPSLLCAEAHNAGGL